MNEQNEKNEQLKEATLEAMKVYQKVLDDELLKTQKKLSEKLERLCQTGVDEKYKCCLEDVDVEGYYPHRMQRENVMRFKEEICTPKHLCGCLEKENFDYWHFYNEEINYSIEEIRYIRRLVNQIAPIYDAIRALTYN